MRDLWRLMADRLSEYATADEIEAACVDYLAARMDEEEKQ